MIEKLEALDECLSSRSCSGIDSQLHLIDFLVNFIEKSDDEVNQLVLVHLLRVRVSDQEADVVALKASIKSFHQLKQQINFMFLLTAKWLIATIRAKLFDNRK